MTFQMLYVNKQFNRCVDRIDNTHGIRKALLRETTLKYWLHEKYNDIYNSAIISKNSKLLIFLYDTHYRKFLTICDDFECIINDIFDRHELHYETRYGYLTKDSYIIVKNALEKHFPLNIEDDRYTLKRYYALLMEHKQLILDDDIEIPYDILLYLNDVREFDNEF